MRGVKIDGDRVAYTAAAADLDGTDGGQNAAQVAAENQPKHQTTPKVEIDVEVDERKNGFLEPF